jgi:hypothetical protein
MEILTCSLCGRHVRAPKDGFAEAIVACSACGQCLHVIAPGPRRAAWGVRPCLEEFRLSDQLLRLFRAPRCRGWRRRELYLAFILAASGALVLMLPLPRADPSFWVVRSLGLAMAAYFGTVLWMLFRLGERLSRPVAEPYVLAIPRELPAAAARLGDAVRLLWVSSTYRAGLVVLGVSLITVTAALRYSLWKHGQAGISWSLWLGGTFGGLAALAAGLLTGGCRVVLFTGGFAVIRGHRFEACLWDEIASIRYARPAEDTPTVPATATVDLHDGRRIKVFQRLFTDHPGLFEPRPRSPHPAAPAPEEPRR